MRQERIIQASLFDIFATHEIGRELKQISQWLDGHRELIELGVGDLRRHGVKETGGKPTESVLRCAPSTASPAWAARNWRFISRLTKPFQAFARLPLSGRRGMGVPQNDQRRSCRTWEAINRTLTARVGRKSKPARSCGSTRIRRSRDPW